MAAMPKMTTEALAATAALKTYVEMEDAAPGIQTVTASWIAQIPIAKHTRPVLEQSTCTSSTLQTLSPRLRRFTTRTTTALA